MSNHPETRTYVERRDTEGRSKKEIIRCLKRYTARELFRLSSSDHAWDQIQELTAVAHYRNVLEVLVGVNGCVQGERSIDYVEPEHATDGQTESSVEQHDREPNCIADDPDLLVVA